MYGGLDIVGAGVILSPSHLHLLKRWALSNPESTPCMADAMGVNGLKIARDEEGVQVERIALLSELPPKTLQ